jgi:hypothetical protein
MASLAMSFANIAVGQQQSYEASKHCQVLSAAAVVKLHTRLLMSLQLLLQAAGEAAPAGCAMEGQQSRPNTRHAGAAAAGGLRRD